MKPFSREHQVAARNEMAEQGYEMTPAECEEQRREAFGKIRNEMIARGCNVPDDEQEFFLFVHRKYYQTGRVNEILDLL